MSVREEILDAARELFVREGYHGVSIRKIAEARVQEAAALLADAQVQWRLIEDVRDKRAIRDEDRQRRRRAVEAAEARPEVARQELTRIRAGTWKPDLEIAAAELAVARQQVERIRADLQRLSVTSPIDGQVLQCKGGPRLRATRRRFCARVRGRLGSIRALGEKEWASTPEESSRVRAILPWMP